MLRIALIRGAFSGAVTAVAALGKVIVSAAEGSGDAGVGYIGPVIAVAAISGATTIVVALIYVIGPYLLKKRSENDPAFRQTQDEAIDALVSELVRKELENQKLERRLAERDRRHGDRRGGDDPSA